MTDKAIEAAAKEWLRMYFGNKSENMTPAEDLLIDMRAAIAKATGQGKES